MGKTNDSSSGNNALNGIDIWFLYRIISLGLTFTFFYLLILQQKLNKAYRILGTGTIYTTHLLSKLTSSPDSETPGLAFTNVEKLPPRGQEKANDYYVKGKVLGPFICFGPKTKGVEPGFSGMLRQDVYQWADKYLGLKQGEVEERLKSPALTSLLIDSLSKYGIPRYFIKQDYIDPTDSKVNENTSVGASEEDWKRTSTVRKSLTSNLMATGLAAFKTDPILTKNLNAIFETLATAIAGIVTKVHKQNLLEGNYQTPNGQKKLMLCAPWELQFRDFEKQIIVNGNQGVLIKLGANAQPLMNSKGYYLSDDTITDLGRILLLAVIFDDYDFVGSLGGNKGHIGNNFFGIDFGHCHCLRAPNAIIAGLQTDFSLPKLPSKYKNFSIFFDTEIAQKHECLLIFNKLRTGQMPPISVLVEYSFAFQKKLYAIQKDDDLKIFDAYKEKFPTYIEKIDGAQKYYLEAVNNALSIFKNRINLSPKTLEFMDSLEKLCSETSVIFEGVDGKKVQLNHLHKESRIAFEPVPAEPGFFAVKAKEGTKVKESLIKYVAAQKIDAKNITIKLQDEGFFAENSFLLIIPIGQLETFYEHFAERKIAAYKNQPLPEKTTIKSAAVAFFHTVTKGLLNKSAATVLAAPPVPRTL